MKPRNEDALVARLLSGRDGLSMFEKEHMLDALVRASAQASTPKSKMAWYHWAIAAAGLVVAIPVASVLWSGQAAETLTAKGGGGMVAAFTASCPAHSPPQSCQQGDKLIFSVETTAELPFFAAFATRSDGAVLWYYPQDEKSLSIDTQKDADKVIDSAIVLGQEHPPGRYRVHGVFSAQALNRTQIRQRFEQQQHDDVLIIERSVEIEQP